MREVAQPRTARLLCSSLPLLLAACAGQSAAPDPAASVPGPAGASSAPAVPEAAVIERALSPGKLEPAADLYPADQYAYHAPDASASRSPRLVVYLVGKGNTPE